MNQMVEKCHSYHVEEPFKKLSSLDPNQEADNFQNLTVSSFSKDISLMIF